MKIVYDISMLGYGHRKDLGRTGIYRVVENVARGLATCSELDLALYAGNDPWLINACLDYQAIHTELSGLPLINGEAGRLRQSLRKYQQVSTTPIRQLFKQADLHSVLRELKLGQRVARRLSNYVSTAVEKWVDRKARADLNGADIFHSMMYTVPDSLAQTPRVTKFVTVYDLIPILFPDISIPGDSQRIAHDILSLTKEHWVFCISECTKADLCAHTSVNPDRVFVTPLAASPDLFYHCPDPERQSTVRRKYQIPDGPYMLCVNTLEPRKNIDSVIRNFARLVREQSIVDLSLVLVGAKGWHYDKIFEAISQYESLKTRIIVTGYVADEDLAPLYSGATVFVYPSFYEGFGLPPLEAMQCGTPVITANSSSLPEVVGDAGIMVDPLDNDALSQAMLDVYRDSSLRATLSAKSLERSRQFTWESCTRQIVNGYKLAAGSNP